MGELNTKYCPLNIFFDKEDVMEIATYGQGRRLLGLPPLFNPQEGTTIMEPPGGLRRPRPVRGGECCIAESEDGVKFRPIWQAKKENFNSPSVEKSCLVKTIDGKYRLYISYVDPISALHKLCRPPG